MAPEQLKQVETALHSEKAKQILGDGVSSVLGRRYIINSIISFFFSFFIQFLLQQCLLTQKWLFEYLLMRSIWKRSHYCSYLYNYYFIYLFTLKCIIFLFFLLLFNIFIIDTLKIDDADDWIHLDHCYTASYCGNKKSKAVEHGHSKVSSG